MREVYLPQTGLSRVYTVGHNTYVGNISRVYTVGTVRLREVYLPHDNYIVSRITMLYVVIMDESCRMYIYRYVWVALHIDLYYL